MERVPVVSSVMASVGYDDNTLEIEFTRGDVYQYFDVPESIHQALMQAESHGTFFNSHVRGAYRFGRV
jgi:hypothetical protein